MARDAPVQPPFEHRIGLVLLFAVHRRASRTTLQPRARVDRLSTDVDMQPESLHQRVPAILGSRNEVETVVSYHATS